MNNTIKNEDKIITHRVNDAWNGEIVFIGDFDDCYEWKHEHGYGYIIVELNESELKIANKK
jgi:hypothetical protein